MSFSKSLYLTITMTVGEILTRQRFEQLMLDKIERLNFASAKVDMQPFVTDSAQIADWSADLFCHILAQTQTTETL